MIFCSSYALASKIHDNEFLLEKRQGRAGLLKYTYGSSDYAYYGPKGNAIRTELDMIVVNAARKQDKKVTQEYNS